jgi:hypothetical protein
MRLLCDWFAAPTDDIAASTIDWVGGPSWPGKRPRQGLVRRGLWPERLRTIDMNGVEPTIQVATLEAILTGRSIAGILDETTQDSAVVDLSGRPALPVRGRFTLRPNEGVVADEAVGP